MEARIKALEEGLNPKAAQLKDAVQTEVEKLGDKSPTTRRNFMDIFNTTVPDPVEVMLAEYWYLVGSSPLPTKNTPTRGGHFDGCDADP